MLDRWQSLAQWLRTESATSAKVARVMEAWPGYQTVADASILNAYYTDPDVIDTVWGWLERNGVTSAVGFEPGCGRGDWMVAAPEGVRFDAVDIDPISVVVAGARGGDRVNVVESRLEDWHLARGTSPDGYDVVVGNVPFGSWRPGVNNPHGDNLHNLAIARSVDMLRPGGVAAVITSRFSLDAAASRGWRERVAAEVDLVAAFRLPSNTHKEAGTAVVTDVLILRRPLPGETRPPATWVDTGTLTIDDTTVPVNRYWLDNPDHVLGEVELGGAYNRENISVRLTDGTAAERLAAALASHTVTFGPVGEAPAAGAAAVEVVTAHGRRLPAGSIVVDPSSSTGFSRDGAEHKVAKAERAELSSLLTLRDRALEYLDHPTDDARAELRALYDAYVDEHGPINRYGSKPGRPTEAEPDPGMVRDYPKLGGFRTDPSFWNVGALEVFDDDTRTATPAAILQRQVLDTFEHSWPDSADTIQLAVAQSLARYHRIDPNYVASQLGLDPAETERQLESVAFVDPTNDEWVVADRYLSGDVRTRLDDAHDAVVAGRSEFARNVDALKAVQPEPLTAAEITPEFGVPWLEPADLNEFIYDLARRDGQLRYHPPTGIWSHQGRIGGPAPYQTDKLDMSEVIVAACNRKSVVVMKDQVQPDGTTKTVVDQVATAQHEQARNNLVEALANWVWSDPDRAARLVDRYNAMFNRLVPETWDGSHLELPGLSGEFTPRPHQLDVVWRTLCANDHGTLMAHGVGAGKTAAMIISAQEARRTGKVTGTALFVVPNSMVEQFARDFKRLYPAARVITPIPATKTASVKDALRELAARVATGDYDAAVITHDQVGTIPLSPDVERRILTDRIAEFNAYNLDDTAAGRAKANLEKRKQTMHAKLEALRDTQVDPSITYLDKMPIGMLVVDEAHLAKNIYLNSNIEGLGPSTPAARAEALLTFADLIRERSGPAAVITATATPIPNSAHEMWVMARLAAPAMLDRSGLRHFDAFAANFLNAVPVMELNAKQELVMKTRIAEYKNFPDLARIFRAFTDVRRSDQLGLNLPELVGGEARLHTVTPSQEQRDVVKWCAERADGHHIALSGDTRDADPIIAVLGSARTSSLHPATISAASLSKYATRSYPNLAFSWDDPSPKITAAADQIAEIYHRTATWTYPNSTVAGAAQAVFCDYGVPNPTRDGNAYELLTQMLVDRGVDPTHIRSVHAAGKGRDELFEQVRNGTVRVLLGSTGQMGVGVNIQQRLYAIHELTAPYRPDWLEQAEGRMIRQGNQNPTVELHRYVTVETADANAWQMLARKMAFIEQAMSTPDELTRSLRDESHQSDAQQFAQIAALATGDPRHVRKAQLTSLVDRLERAERGHASRRSSQRKIIEGAERRIESLTTQIDTLAALRPTIDDDTTAKSVGQQILDHYRTAHPYKPSTLTLCGIEWTWDPTGYDPVLKVRDTPLRTDIAMRDLRTNHDEGVGLGRRVLNRLHPDKIAATITQLVDRRDAEHTRLNSERAIPVPDVFPDAAELAAHRAELNALVEQLATTNTDTDPNQLALDHTSGIAVDTGPDRPVSPPTATAAPSPTAATAASGAVAVDGAVPLTDRPRNEQAGWTGAFRYYTPGKPGSLGNHARDDDTAWEDAVNELIGDPTKIHTARGRQAIHLGNIDRISLHARTTRTGDVRIDVATAFAYTGTQPHLLLRPGQRLTASDVRRWLAHHAANLPDPNQPDPAHHRSVPAHAATFER